MEKKNAKRPKPIRRLKSSPLPEAISDRSWTIQEQARGGRVGMGPSGGIMGVPLGLSDKDRFIRNHEMAHVKWSPETPPMLDGVPFEVLNGAEDARIHRLMANSDIDVSPGILDEGDVDLWVRQLAKAAQPQLGAASLQLACIGTGDEDIVRRGLEAAGYDDALDIADKIHERYMVNGDLSFDMSVQAAEMMTQLLWQVVPPKDEEGCKPGDGTYKEGGAMDAPAGEGMTLDERIADDARKMLRTVFDERGGGKPATRRPGYEAPEVPWGKMKVIEGKCTKPLPQKMRGRERKKKEYGTYFGAAHRWAVDGKIFVERQPVKERGGAVLVDGSGSMSLTTEQVDTLMHRFPAGVIAIYSGNHSSGTLRVLARKGKRLRDDELDRAIHAHGQGNIVDGPALDWLGKQKGKKIWVSDGWVTGVGDGYSVNCVEDAVRKCKQHKILRVEHPWKVIEEADAM